MQPGSVEAQNIWRSLASSDLFRDLEEPTLNDFESELELVTLKPGDILMRQGELGNCLFVVLGGRLRAFIHRDNGAEEAVGEISAGEVVGEMAIIADEPRSATVRAVRPSTLVRLTRAGFERIETQHPQVVKPIARLLVQRLNRVNAPGERRKTPLTLCVLSAVPDGSLASFITRFTEALPAHGTTFRLDPAVIDQQLGAGAAQAPVESEVGIQVTNWISDKEKAHRFVVYEATDPGTPWAHRAIGHSDRVLIIVSGDQSPSAGDAKYTLAAGLGDSLVRKDLVVIHTVSNRSPAGTWRWREIFAVDDHHHLRLYDSADFARLARIVAGSAIGLVLGGGGARSFAHIGVIRALTEANIPIDFVGGVSVGAIIAGECAMDWTPERMLKANRDAFYLHPLHGDQSSPVVSGRLAQKTVRLFEILFGENCIEDQWRSFFCVSCSLNRGEIVVHRKGRFHDCVEASSALPLLSPPVLDNGDLLVDGALINNLPADIMRHISGGRVIAVDVSARLDLQSPGGTGTTTAGGGRVVRSFRQETKTIPNAYSIAMRTVMLNSVISASSMKRHIDLYLRPPVDHLDMFDWMAIEKAAEAGYRYTSEELQKSEKAAQWREIR